MCQILWKSGSLNLLEPSGLHRDCYGTALLLPLTVDIEQDQVYEMNKKSGQEDEVKGELGRPGIKWNEMIIVNFLEQETVGFIILTQASILQLPLLTGWQTVISHTSGLLAIGLWRNVRLFVCFPAVTIHCGCIFHSPVAGFSLLVFEVSWSHTTTRHSR